MTLKNAAKNAAFAVGMFVFPVKPKAAENTYDVDAHIAAIQESFKNSVDPRFSKNL
jgi:hypothetical protein